MQSASRLARQLGGPGLVALSQLRFANADWVRALESRSITAAELRRVPGYQLAKTGIWDTPMVQGVPRQSLIALHALSMHANAMRAAQAALCAGDQGQFWGMHDLLFGGSAESLAGEGILQSARNLPMDTSEFKSCLDGGKRIPDVLKDTQDAAALQLNGTPSFLIGRTTAEGVKGLF